MCKERADPLERKRDRPKLDFESKTKQCLTTLGHASTNWKPQLSSYDQK